MDVPLRVADFKQSAEEASMHETINCMMSRARMGSCAGELSHVEVEVKCKGDCSLKEVINFPRTAKLRPGQQLTILVKINIPIITSKWSLGENKGAESRKAEFLRQEGSAGVFEQLGQILGKAETNLFTTEVSYNHSLFPKDTRLTAQNTCRIRRVDGQSVWAGPFTGGQIDYTVEYNKALFVAKTWPPDAALKRLRRKFRSAHLEAGHESGLHQILDELEFQFNVQQRIEEQQARYAVEEPIRGDAVSVPRSSSRRATLHLPNEGMQPGALTVSRVITAERSSAPSLVTDETTSQTTPRKRDAARQIWQHMRRDSRSASFPNIDMQSQPSNESLNRLEAADVKLREIRRQALQNKRSVGADTLRDFRWEESRYGAEYGSERGMPWM